MSSPAVSSFSLSMLLSLMRLRVSVFAASAAVLGYVLADGRVLSDSLLVGLGVLLLSGGASALNQVQERDVDARMRRTRGRPLPSGRMDVLSALFVALGLCAAGLFILMTMGSFAAVNLSLLALLWYNALYTPLKRRTEFSILIGAGAGALPPAIGWCAAGGDLWQGRLLMLCFFFYMWQVPHFWLLMAEHCEDYRASGLRTLAGRLDAGQIRRVTVSWVFATSISCLLVAAGTQSLLWAAMPSAAAVWLFVRGAGVLMRRSELSFASVNAFMAIVMAGLFAGGLWR